MIPSPVTVTRWGGSLKLASPFLDAQDLDELLPQVEGAQVIGGALVFPRDALGHLREHLSARGIRVLAPCWLANQDGLNFWHPSLGWLPPALENLRGFELEYKEAYLRRKKDPRAGSLLNWDQATEWVQLNGAEARYRRP